MSTALDEYDFTPDDDESVPAALLMDVAVRQVALERAIETVRFGGGDLDVLKTARAYYEFLWGDKLEDTE